MTDRPVAGIDRLLGLFKNPLQWYGLTSNNLARNALAGAVVTGGNTVWGTELALHDGTVIESGDTEKAAVLQQIFITAVGSINRPTYLQFFVGDRGSAVACTFETTANTVTKNGHGLANGTKVMVTGASIPAAINTYTTYYVINQTANTFQLSLTLGGSAIVFAGNGSGNYHTITQDYLAELLINVGATTGMSTPTVIGSPSFHCNKFIWARGLATVTGTNAITFFMGIETY